MTTEITSGRTDAPARPSNGRPARKKRLPKRVVRGWAYLGGGVAFLIPWAVLNQAPKPATAGTAEGGSRQVIELHKIIRRIVIDAPAASVPAGYSGKPQVRYVYVGGGSSGGGTSTHCSTCP